MEEKNLSTLFTGFMAAFTDMQNLMHGNAIAHGWWDEPAYKERVRELLTGTHRYSSEKAHREAVDAALAAIPDYNPAEKIALMHSELSEALEGLRGDNKSDKLENFTAEEEELADAVIRAMDYAGKRGLRLAEAIVVKGNYNISRPYKHGGKKF